ncbi:SGNH/GDSL hydrolase family protein [Leifsonia aquatica]|uniref:GDSL-like protein n=2 Tax=Leifsonia aquatica TaxID=144185 RepID=U2SWY6_LEIAQ|nr:SGNH/GDSL hydrolase family protein [Leifsonia aquatica]ERK69793.1 GDSL-like protein [Leifsonia aquatica ATCC 14665]MBB2968487.1 lysophospholipase L1-like esterase [Leifsonia aquatica]
MNTTGRVVTTVGVAGAIAGGAAYAWSRVQQKRAAVAAGKVKLNESLPVNSKWWRDAAKVEGEILYVAIGDSAAQGIGASQPKNSYVGVIADHLRSATGRTVRTVNLSVSGATVALAVADQLPRFETLQPDIVTVSIGANDIGAFDPATFREGIRRVFAALPRDAVVADLPYFYLPWNEKKVAVANAILREEAADAGLTVASLHRAMKQEGLRGAFTQFAEDLFHPNDHGYRVWASAFLPAVTRLAVTKFPRRPATTATSASVTASSSAPDAPAPSPTPAR